MKGTPRPRKLPPAQQAEPAPRIASLLAAAEQVFLTKGYHNATMSDIARQAGMSKRTVYTLIPSKEELFAELLAHRQSQVQFPVPEPGWTDEDILAATLICLAKFMLSPKQISITRLVITEYSQNPDFSRAFLKSRLHKAKQHLESCLTDLAASYGVERTEAKELAAMLFGMALGEFHIGALSGLRAAPSTKMLETRIRRVVKIFLAGMRNVCE